MSSCAADAQRKWYAIWAVVGLIIGILLAWLGTVLWCAFKPGFIRLWTSLTIQLKPSLLDTWLILLVAPRVTCGA